MSIGNDVGQIALNVPTTLQSATPKVWSQAESLVWYRVFFPISLGFPVWRAASGGGPLWMPGTTRGRELVERSEDDDAMFLNYFALGLLIVVFITVFYAIIAIHDIPYEIARHRDHPHQDAIHAAGWVSLLTLHVLWPFLWIWSMAYRPERGWGFSHSQSSDQQTAMLERHEQRLAALEQMNSGHAPKLASASRSEPASPGSETSDPRV